MNYIRVSPSLLYQVERGYIDLALQRMDSTLPPPSTTRQDAGKKLHLYTEKYIEKYGKLPDLLGGHDVSNWKTEVKLTTKWQWHDWEIELVGVIDLLRNDNKLMRDWKYGTTSEKTYDKTMQHKCYKLIVPQALYFIYTHYDILDKDYASSIIRLTKDDALEAQYYVETMVGELINHILYRYGNKKFIELKTDNTLRFRYTR